MNTGGREYLGRAWRMIALTVFFFLCLTLIHGALDTSANAAAPQKQAQKPSKPATDSDPLPGQIKDDETVAPDAEESADNSASFPVDI
jgi:hypothetical protein